MRSGVYRAERAVLRRLDPDGVGNLRASQGSGREMGGSAVDGLAATEADTIGPGHSMHVVRIHKIEVANIGVENIPVADEGIAGIDPLEEFVTAVEPREERFSKAEREPANSKSETAAQETHKSRPIDRRTKDRARAPAPPSAKIVPSAIVVRSKTPWRVVNPGPAPRADVVPVAIAIRSPARANIVGIPDMAIFRLILPRTGIIEIAVARRFARNILSGNRVVFFQVAVSSPAVEAVRTGSFVHNVVDVVRAGEFPALTGVHFIGLAAGGNFPFATDHGHAGGIAGFIYVNAKCPSLLHGESQIRSVHFVEVTFAQFTDAEVDAALGKAHLRDALVKVQEGESCHTAKMDGSRASLQFSSRILVHPKLVADSDRTVSGRATPVTFPAGLQGYGTVNKADTCDARWGILFFIRSRLRSGKTQKTGETQQQA